MRAMDANVKVEFVIYVIEDFADDSVANDYLVRAKQLEYDIRVALDNPLVVEVTDIIPRSSLPDAIE